jgi:S1-C subfamily serine protease
MTSYPPFPVRRSSALPTAIAGAAFVLAVFLLLERVGWFTPAASGEPRAVTPRGELAPLEENFIDVFEKCSPSVANINTSQIVRTSWGRVAEQQGTGSGFVWDDAGTVVTNNHVVANAREVTVTVGGRTYRATVVNSSENHDLAVLKLQGDVSQLKPLPLGSSSDLRVGQTAIVIGNPFGFDQTMTTGIVSALNRTIQSENGSVMHDVIQVDAAVNPGNSGGPLLDSAGRLIGVTTAIYSPSGANAGIGFAVPVDTVNSIVPRLLGGRSTQVVLGVQSDYDSYRLDPGTGFVSGAIVTKVVGGYGAAAAGLQPFNVQEGPRGQVIQQYGDVIVAIDGKPVRAFRELPRALRGFKPGDHVAVTVIRGLPEAPKKVDLSVTLAAEGEGQPTGM